MLVPVTTYVFPGEILELRPLSHRDNGYLVQFKIWKGTAWAIIKIKDLAKIIYGEVA